MVQAHETFGDVVDAIGAGQSLTRGSSGGSGGSAGTPRSAAAIKRASKKMGKRPGELSSALKEKLGASAASDTQPGMRVQLARSISMVFAPSGYEAGPDVGSVPEDSLELQHVHGYSGKTGRSNVFLNEDGHVVYPLAALGVVSNPTEKAQRHFKGHSDDVTCLAMHPGKRFVATGRRELLPAS